MFPSLYISHGSPMLALEPGASGPALARLAAELPKPEAIVIVSAHWESNELLVSGNPQPETWHDFGGFPQALFDVEYPAPGHPALAREAVGAVTQTGVIGTQQWGLDHGTWTVLKHLYPKADIPVFQLSIDYDKPAAFHYAIGRDLAALRDKGVLVMGSGNVVHNLRATDRGTPDGLTASRPWAQSFDDAVKAALAGRDDRALIAYEKLEGAATAVAMPDHYFPFLYALGAAGAGERPKTVYEGFQSGTLSMRCLQFG